MELEKKIKAVCNTPLSILSELLDPNTTLMKGDEGPEIAEEALHLSAIALVEVV